MLKRLGIINRENSAHSIVLLFFLSVLANCSRASDGDIIVSGYVYDETGRGMYEPLNYIEVDVVGEHGILDTNPDNILSNAEGHFEFSVQAGKPFGVVLHAGNAHRVPQIRHFAGKGNVKNEIHVALLTPRQYYASRREIGASPEKLLACMREEIPPFLGHVKSVVDEIRRDLQSGISNIFGQSSDCLLPTQQTESLYLHEGFERIVSDGKLSFISEWWNSCGEEGVGVSRFTSREGSASLKIASGSEGYVIAAGPGELVAKDENWYGISVYVPKNTIGPYGQTLFFWGSNRRMTEDWTSLIGISVCGTQWKVAAGEWRDACVDGKAVAEVDSDQWTDWAVRIQSNRGEVTYGIWKNKKPVRNRDLHPVDYGVDDAIYLFVGAEPEQDRTRPRALNFFVDELRVLNRSECASLAECLDKVSPASDKVSPASHNKLLAPENLRTW